MNENPMKEKMLIRERNYHMCAIAAEYYGIVMNTNKLERALSAFRNFTTLLSINVICNDDITKMLVDMEKAIKKLALEKEV